MSGAARPNSARSSPPRTPSAGLAAAAVAAALLAVLVYAVTFDAPFLYDDHDCVVSNPLIHDPANAGLLWSTPYPPQWKDRGLYRPFTSTTFLLDRMLFGLDPGAFHRSNVVLHAAASALLVTIVVRLGAGLGGGFAAGALFAVHPVATESVSWVVGRAEVLSGLGCLAAVAAWLRYRRTGAGLWLAAAASAYFLALGSKETAAPLPAALLLGDAFGALGGARPRRAAEWLKLLRPYAVLAAIFAGYAALRVGAVGGFAIVDEHLAFTGRAEQARLPTAAAGWGRLLLLMVVPVTLRVDYTDSYLQSLAEPPALAGLAVLVGLVVGAVSLARTRPALAVGLAWVVLFFLPVSNLVIEIGAVFAERFLYLPLVAVAALGGAALGSGLAASRREHRVATALLGLVLVAGLGARTVARNRDWSDAERFWRAGLAGAPGSEKMHLYLSNVVWDEHRRTGASAPADESIELLRDGIALYQPSAPTVSHDHLVMLDSLGDRLRERGRKEEAGAAYAQLLALLGRTRLPEFAPIDEASVILDYGVILLQLGRIEEAAELEQWRRARRSPSAPGNLATAAERGRELDLVLAWYRAALELGPEHPQARLRLGLALHGLGRHAEALAPLKRALADGGTEAQAVVPRVARAAYEQAQAAGDFRRAYEIIEGLSAVIGPRAGKEVALGRMAERLGERELAREHYQRALALDPDSESAREGLSSLADGIPEK